MDPSQGFGNNVFDEFMASYMSGVPPFESGSATANPAVPSNAAPVANVTEYGPTNPAERQRKVLTRRKTAAESSKKSNYGPTEDVYLVKSWLEISCDPMVGIGQKKDKFWDRIIERYNMKRGPHVDRSLRSLQSRFDMIKADVSKFAGYMAEAARKNPSGMTDSDKTSLAAAEFAKNEGYPFNFMHCWEIMKNEPKWMDMRQNRGKNAVPEDTSMEQWPDAANMIDLEQSQSVGLATSFSTGKRPIGRDAAKSRSKRSSSTSGSAPSPIAATLECMTLRMDDDTRCWKDLQVEYLKGWKEEREAKERIEREKLELEKKKMLMQEKREEERILSIDPNQYGPNLRIYYENLQKQILAKIAAESSGAVLGPHGTASGTHSPSPGPHGSSHVTSPRPQL